MMQEKTVVNLDYLQSLSKGNKKFEADMIRLFLEEVPSEISQLQEGIDKEDYGKIRAAAHKMKSTIPFAGVDRVIGNELSSVEQLAREGHNLQVIQDEFRKIRQACETACRELKNFSVS